MTGLLESGAGRVPDYADPNVDDSDARIRGHRNESAFTVPQAVLDALHALGADDLRRYPAGRYADLARLAAAKLDVSPEGFAFANGSDDLILALCAAYSGERTSVVVARPTFAMYARAARLHGAEVREVPYTTRWRRDPAALLDACDDGTRLLFLAHPNNPTGDPLEPRTVCELLASLPNALVVIDEAYAVAPLYSYFPDVASYPNLAVISTLSKVPGLAGLRCGFAAAQPAVARAVRRVMQPYPLSVCAAAAMNAYFERVVDDHGYLAAYREFVAASLDRIVTELGPLAQRVTRGECAFVVLEFGVQAKRIEQALRARGIFVRMLDAAEFEGGLRINALGSPETGELISAIKANLEPAHA